HPATRRVSRASERVTEHDGIRTHRDGLDDVSRRAETAIRDDVNVAATRLVEVVATSAGNISDRGRHRRMDAEAQPRRRRGPSAEPYKYARGSRAHEVQRGCVARGTAHDDRNV